jgi:hypothetical protein
MLTQSAQSETSSQSPRAAWFAVLSGDLAERSSNIAQETARRLRDRATVEAAVLASEGQTSFPLSVHWQASSVAQGFAGLAIMHAYFNRCFPGTFWDEDALTATRLAAWELAGHLPQSVGLFSGLSGVAFAVNYHNHPRCAQLMADINQHIFTEALRLGETVPKGRDYSVGVFDAISGISGLGMYLLSVPGNTAGRDEAVRSLAEAMIYLSGTDDGIPRWRTPSHLIGDDTTRRYYPFGSLNCGLAHGAPSILAFLAQVAASGFEMAGLEQGIRSVADWMIDNRLDDEFGVNWPNSIPLEMHEGKLRSAAPERAPFGPSRSAWCYGPPGIAAALHLAGNAISESRYSDLASETMEVVLRRPVPRRQIDSPTFCHGVAGLLQIVLRFAVNTRREIFIEGAHALTEQLLAEYDPVSRLGFCSIEPGGAHVDQPGLLDGAAGVAITLLAACSPIEPAWDRLFLIS